MLLITIEGVLDKFKNRLLQEKEIILEVDEPLAFFGVGDKNLRMIKKYFPKIKVIGRGNMLKALGEEKDIEEFELKIAPIIEHYEKYNKLTEGNVISILEEENKIGREVLEDKVVLYGVNGRVIKVHTENQRLLVKSSEEKDMVFAIGPAGTGKTYTAVALAVRALKNKEVKKIILTRPAVEAGETLGFLPGDIKDKLDPYMQPIYDALFDMIPNTKLIDYMERRVIEIAPLAFMRGRTLDNAFVLLDEAQNATISQMKMFLTRMGKSAKFIINGDLTQIDLPPRQKSGLIYALDRLADIDEVGIIRLSGRDVIRHRLVKKIIKAFEKD
ncbi:MAG: phosphate starvation-inducible PhoH-like protein, partial [Gammaproteobacteria bacterium]